MRLTTRLWLLLAALLVSPLPGTAASAQLKYLKAQSVVPVFEGWRKRPDGTILMYFGYLNRNYEQTLDVPVGPDNRFEPGDPDRGQPTFFQTRRQRYMFTVALPKDWDEKQRLVWTVVANGQPEKAQGWLQPEWEIDDGVMQMNTGGGGSPPTPNAGPALTVSAKDITASVSSPLTLTASARDDGIPKPRRPASPTAPPPRGVNVRWFKYRGPGEVTFSPSSKAGAYSEPVELSTQVTFGSPGTYVLRALATDGFIDSSEAVTVTVR